MILARPCSSVWAIGMSLMILSVGFSSVVVDGAKSPTTFSTPSAAFSSSPSQAPTPASSDDEDKVIVSFDYMKEFMKDVFLTYGVPEDRAVLSADVLIESDKRGIDSHGLGRLKPIYCDRMDQGILFPDQPIEIIRETDTTAMVDGNLGIGLYIGPYCMQL